MDLESMCEFVNCIYYFTNMDSSSLNITIINIHIFNGRPSYQSTTNIYVRPFVKIIATSVSSVYLTVYVFVSDLYSQDKLVEDNQCNTCIRRTS